MQVTIEIPDAFVAQLKLNGCSMSRELLEGFAVEPYPSEKLSSGQVSELRPELLGNRGVSPPTWRVSALRPEGPRARQRSPAHCAFAMIVISDTSPINYRVANSPE